LATRESARLSGEAKDKDKEKKAPGAPGAPGTPAAPIKAQTGLLTCPAYHKLLEQVRSQGAVFTLTVSNGADERVFYMTRGAILFAGTGTTGGDVLVRKLLAKRLLTREKVAELSALTSLKSPLIQDVIRERNALNPDVLQGVVEEVLEDQLLEVATWDQKIAFYDLVWANPPRGLYAKNTAVRLSFGLNPLLTRVLPKIADVPDKIHKPLGGSLRNRVRPLGGVSPPSNETERAVLALVTEKRTCLSVLAQAIQGGIPPHDAALALASLASARRVGIEDVPPTPEEEVALAREIEKHVEDFLNKLITRMHLAGIYERANDKEKAVEQFRAIAAEHMARDHPLDALAALKNAVKLDADDLAVREDLVKALIAAGRPFDAAKEAVELARILLARGLPGRARQALEIAAKLTPNNLGILWMLAGLLEKLGMKDEAVRRYKQIAEVAHQQGDVAGELAANQKLLSLDPTNEKLLEAVRARSGYRRALIVRRAISGAAIGLTAIFLGYASYEIFALRAFRDAQTRAWAAVDEERYDVARSIVDEFVRSWKLSRFRKLASEVVSEINETERLAKDRRQARALRLARAFEAERKIPEAADLIRNTLAREDRADKRDALERLASNYDQMLKDAKEAVLEVRQLAGGRERTGYDLATRTLTESPWVAKAPDFRIPCLVETVPPGAKVALDGVSVDRSTPVVVEFPLGPVRMTVGAQNRETVVQDLGDQLPQWPIQVGLPRQHLWTITEAGGSGQPLRAGKIVVATCDDRTVVAADPETGTIVWHTALGLFGESTFPPVATAGVVVVRTTDGTLVALDAATGAERWRRALAANADDDSLSGRPVAGPDGVVALDGSQALAYVHGADGKVRWRVPVRGTLTGPPVVAGDHALIVFNRTVQALRLADGGAAWTATLPLPAATGAVVGPRGHACVGLEGGSLAWVEQGSVVRHQQGVVTSSIASIDGGQHRVVVGSVTGELAAVTDMRSNVFRITLNKGVPISWVGCGASDVVLASDGKTLYTTDARGTEQWRDATNGSPACADETKVFQSGPGGLCAIAR
jgi:outer membrane protein assembly factor BamB/tetratricopeptide (TPR) repeat protein